MMFSIVDIDYSIFDTIRMLSGVELMIIITLFMGLMPIFRRMRSLESKVIDIQFSISKMTSDIDNLSHVYNYRDLKTALDSLNGSVIDVIKFLNKNHDFKIRESNQIKYLDYDP